MASWFYLTLWRGNPPEMTDYRDVAIDTGDRHGVTVYQADAQAGSIRMTDRAAAVINENDSFGVEVEQKNEVIWIVGTDH